MLRPKAAGPGAFVTPGFIDMHAHVAFGPVSAEVRDGVPVMAMTYDESISRAYVSRLLDHGVTTIRNPAGPAEHAVALRDAVNAGAWRGPRVFTAAEVLEQGEFPGLAVPVYTVEDVRREVDRQAALGWT